MNAYENFITDILTDEERKEQEELKKQRPLRRHLAARLRNLRKYGQWDLMFVECKRAKGKGAISPIEYARLVAWIFDL